MFADATHSTTAGVNDMDNWDISSISPTGLLGIVIMGMFG
jgi:hypothetical protein